MGLYLTDREAADLAAALDVLVSPLEHAELPAWSDAALEATKRVFRADLSMLILALGPEPHLHSRDFDPSVFERFRGIIAGSADHGVQSRDAVMEAGLAARRANGLGAWTNRRIAELAGLELDETPFYRDVLKPVGVEYGFGLTAPLPAGEAWLSLACSARDPAWLGEDRTRRLLSLLLPAFRGGVRLLAAVHAHRETLAAALDAIGTGMALFDLRGRELHRNAALRALLELEPQPDPLLGAVLSLAGGLARSRAPRRRSGSSPDPRAAERQVATPIARYRLQGSYLPPGAVAPDAAVLVLVDRVARALPDERRLRERFGLTPAECRLIPWIAAGHTNARIARGLGTSSNTVRNQLQSIYRKLGVRSRAGVLGALAGFGHTETS